MTRPIRSRDARAQQKAVRAEKEWSAVRDLKVIDTEPEDLSAWLDDSPLTLSTGERVDLREDWAVPKQE